jgi:hypothetical protein
MGIMASNSNLWTPHINFTASHPTMSPGLVGYILSVGWVSSHRTTQMEMASVSKTLVDFKHLMQLLAHPFY